MFSLVPVGFVTVCWDGQRQYWGSKYFLAVFSIQVNSYMSHGTLSLFVKTPSWSRAPAPLCCDLVLFVGLGCAASLFLPVLAKRPSHELSMAHCAFVVRSICVTSASIPSDLDLFRCFPSIDAPNIKQREDASTSVDGEAAHGRDRRPRRHTLPLGSKHCHRVSRRC